MPRRPARNPQRQQLGRFWLYQRPDTGYWFICWLDTAGRRAVTRRQATGIGGGRADSPPEEAVGALAAHHLEFGQERKLTRDEAVVEDLVADWLKHHVAKLRDPERYLQSTERWAEFWDAEVRSGRLPVAVTVKDITPSVIHRFITWRGAQGVGGHAISRDLAALRGPLNWAWKNHKLDSAPFIADVPTEDKAPPRDRVLSFPEIAKLMEACDRPEREHGLRFMVIELGTAGRPEAVLELTDKNIDLANGLIDPNQPGRRHLRKRRTVVPIAKHVRPWVEDVKGKVIVYRAPITKAKTLAALPPGAPAYFEKPVASIKTLWHTICLETGVCDAELVEQHDANGRPLLRPNGEPQLVWILKPNATPKTLRHTMLTWLARQGVPKEQRNMLAGHVPQDTTGKNYEHLTPDYLADAIDGIDGFFVELGKHTKAHLRSGCDPLRGGLRVVEGGKR